MEKELEVPGASVLDEVFSDTVIETPAAEETPKEETPKEETPKEETPKEEPVPDGYVPIPVHAELRAKARDTEQTLRQQLSESQIAQAKAEARSELLGQIADKAAQAPKITLPLEESPLELFEKEYPGEPVTATVMLDQRKWDQVQSDQDQAQLDLDKAQTRTQTQEQLVAEGIASARETYSAEKMGSEDLTLDAVVALARNHGLISQDDVANLAPYGKRAGDVLYSLATSAIKQAGGESLLELNRRVVTARQTLADKNAKPTKPIPPAKPEGNKPKVDDDDDYNVSGITNFMFR